MRELISYFWTFYRSLFENGRLIPLFLAALIVLIAGTRKTLGRISPLMFVLSVWTAVSYAFTLLVSSVFSQNDPGSKKKRTALLAASSVFFLLIILLSGKSIWSDDFLQTRAETVSREAGLEAVSEKLLEMEENPKIIADADILLGLSVRSSSFVPLYVVPAPGAEDKLPEEDRQLYEVFSTQHPDLERVYRICHDQKRFYAVVDRETTWPEHGFENGFDLMDSIGQYDIYAYKGDAYE